MVVRLRVLETVAQHHATIAVALAFALHRVSCHDIVVVRIEDRLAVHVRGLHVSQLHAAYLWQSLLTG